MNISTLRPGLLVGLSTAIRGGVTYRTRDIEPDHLTEDGTRHASWETDKTIENPEEHERGVKARSRARSIVVAVCSQSTFGLLCPEDKQDTLMEAIAEARGIAQDFNDSATISRLTVNVIVGRVARDDVEAVRAINGEVRDLMLAMERGLKNLDVETVREAANKARSLAGMLSPEAAEKAQVAIAVARSAARLIVKAGETGAVAVDEAVLRRIRESRAAFLDLDEVAEFRAPVATARAVDLELQSEEMPPIVAPVPVAAPAALEF